MHLSETLFLKFRVAHREYFIHNQYFRFQMSSYREGQPHVHTATVAFYWRIEEFRHLGECNDLVELGLDLGTAHPKDRTVQIDIFASGQFRMKTGADLKQACHPTLDADPTLRRFRNPAQDFKEG